MRTRYYGMYQNIVYKINVFEEIRRRAERWFFFSRVLFAAVSILSVLAWSISRTMPALWASLIAFAQIVQSLFDFLPSARQLRALNYLIPELVELQCEIDRDWMRIDYGDLEEDGLILDAVYRYEKRFSDLEAKYTNGVWIPVSGRVKDAAENETDSYFSVRYFLPKGGAANERREPGSEQAGTVEQQQPSEPLANTEPAAPTAAREAQTSAEVGPRRPPL